MAKDCREIDSTKFSYSDQRWFGEISGDVNPIHINPAGGTNVFFGQPVVHGLHLVLWSLDKFGCYCADWHHKDVIGGLQAQFFKPVYLDEKIKLTFINSTQDTITFDITKNNEQLCRIVILRKGFSHTTLVTQNDVSRVRVTPSPKTWEISEVENEKGVIDFTQCSKNIGNRYPYLKQLLPDRVLDSLVALSTLVGMEIPGRNSLFSSFDIKFGIDNQSQGLHYRVKKVYRPSSKIVLEVRASGLSGEVTAFFTPKPCVQSSYSQIQSLAGPNTFAGARVLVIGGSRGLGEVTAKIFAAGNASVLVSYSQSEGSARRIVEEIREGGGIATMLETNVLDKSSIKGLKQSIVQPPTHVFYFPTPKIFARRTAEFESDLFHHYCNYYVDGFYNVVDSLRGLTKESMSYFYPSSIVIDQPHRDLKEYRLAKVSGEALCKELACSIPNISITIERLPRLTTDQTQSLVAVPSEDPTPLLFKLYKKLYGL